MSRAPAPKRRSKKKRPAAKRTARAPRWPKGAIVTAADREVSGGFSPAERRTRRPMGTTPDSARTLPGMGNPVDPTTEESRDQDAAESG